MKTILLTAFFWYLLTYSYAQSGMLDTSFGSSGVVSANLGSFYNYDNSSTQVLTKPDGSIYVILKGQFTGLLVSKRLPNGSIDTTYGIDGYSTSTPFGGPRSL